MVDPRLNSIHLPSVRREEFRHARRALMAACGDQTICVEREAGADPIGSHTLINQGDGAVPPGIECWLVDKDCIYPLAVGLNTIGRAPENDVVVPDAFVSRRHCAILVHHDSRYEIHDVASKNGTYLNGSKLAGPTRIQPGDRITMSDRQLVFMSRNGDPPAPEQHRTLSQ
jgi:hypothetical protein